MLVGAAGVGKAGGRVTVRPARDDELERAGELTAAAYLADGFVRPDGPYLAVLADARSRAQQAELLVAVDDRDRLLGTVTVSEPGTAYAEVSRPGELEFRMLGVDPAARGRGIGELLTRAVIDRARRRGDHRVVLCSAEAMHAAHRLYRRLGFSRLPERDWSPAPGLQLLAFGKDPTDGSGQP